MLLMALTTWTDFCFDGGEKKYMTVNSHETCWIKAIKDNMS